KRFGNPDKEGLEDREGNPIHPVFDWDEVGPEGLYCGDCFEEIVEPRCGECGSGLGQDGQCLHCVPEGEDEDIEPALIQGSNWLALSILDWHGGQWSPSYAVGSSWLALREVPLLVAWEAVRELRRVPGAEKVAADLAEFLEGSGYLESGE